MADNTSGNSEELKLKITPELDQAALRKAQEDLDRLTAKPVVGEKGKTAGGATSGMKAETDFLKYKLSLLKEEKDIRDANLRSIRVGANEQIQLLRQQAATGKITMQQMNADIITQQQLIESTTNESIQSYDQLSASIQNLKAQYAQIPGALGLIAKAELQVLYARQRATTGFDTMSGSMQQMVSQTKNANLAFMNFGRIVQDAPFGLIGIANNIDPLLMSLSVLSNEIDATTGKVRGFGGTLKALGSQLLGPAGIIFLLGSALPSALLMLERYQSNTNKETNKAIEGATSLVEKYLDLKAKVDLAAQGFLDKDEILKKYNKEQGAAIGYANNIIEAEKLLRDNTPNFVQAMFLRTQAQLILNKAAEEYLKITSGETERLSFRERMAFAGSEAGAQAALLRQARKKEEAQKNINDLLEQANKLYIDSNKLVKIIEGTENDRDANKIKFQDLSILKQTKLNIAYERALQLSQNENLTFEQRLAHADRAVGYKKQEINLQISALQEERKLAETQGERLKIDAEILRKRDELLRVDEIIFALQKEAADARVDAMIQSVQMINELQDEIDKMDRIVIDAEVNIDLGEDVLNNRLQEATSWIDNITQIEIEKEISKGRMLKALFLERMMFEAQKREEYMKLGYSQEQAAEMARMDSASKFAQKEKDIRKAGFTEIFQAAGELATQANQLILGDSKEAAITQVIIDTAMGIQKIWAQTGMNPVVGGLLTAALAAKGIVAIRKIQQADAGSQISDTSGTTTKQIQLDSPGLRSGRILTPLADDISASAFPFMGDRDRDVRINASVDRRGLAIAVREGEREIRTQQFDYR